MDEREESVKNAYGEYSPHLGAKRSLQRPKPGMASAAPSPAHVIDINLLPDLLNVQPITFTPAPGHGSEKEEAKAEEGVIFVTPPGVQRIYAQLASIDEPLEIESRGEEAVTIAIGGGTFSLSEQHPFVGQEQEQEQQPSFGLRNWLRWSAKVLTKLAALGLYAMLLLPGHLQVGWYYFSSNSVRRNIVYGDMPRNILDFYLPKASPWASHRASPVVIFVAGGAWMIGNKAWGALFARKLSERDILVASVDYRNFPVATISQMVDDVSRAISFVFRTAHLYGGDAEELYIVGQSAGAHLASCALVRQAEREAASDSVSGWKASQISAFIGISGVYNLPLLADHFHSRGLHQTVLSKLMEGQASFPRFSPDCTVREPSFQPALAYLPPVHLFHGGADTSVPPLSSTSFANALRSSACQVNITVFPDKSHTDMIVQDWMRGGKDELLVALLEIVNASQAMDEMHHKGDRRLVPECCIQLARIVSPF